MSTGGGGFFWAQDGKWITAVFLAYVAGLVLFVVSGFSKAVLVSTLPLASLVGLSGCLTGLRSSRMFGGRKNFTGRLLLFLSASLLILALGLLSAIPVFLYDPNVFTSTSVEGGLLAGFFSAGALVAAFGMFASAWAVVQKLNATVLSRVIIALVFVSVVGFFSNQAEIRLTAGLTPFGAFVEDLPYTLGFLILLIGALILVAQLGKWYASPGISIVAYGYIVLAIVPSVERDILLLSGIDYIVAASMFMGSLTVILYLIGLGLNKVRPKTLRHDPRASPA